MGSLECRKRSPGVGARLVASIVRRSPLDVRKIAWWTELAYQSLGGGTFTECAEIDDRWPAGLQPPIYGRRHGYKMYLDLSDWSDRRAWFFGEYYQRPLVKLFEHLLRPGDCYVDIGANIGMTALVAARCIGPAGLGLAFEPNPDAFSRLSQHISENQIGWVKCFPFGIGLCSTSAELYTGKHLGKASMVGSRGPDYATSITVQIRSGDVVAEKVPMGSPVLVKIDVEGYELEVLRGLDDLLRRKDVALVVEVTDGLLKRNGGSASELYDFVMRFGFRPATFRARQQRLSCPLLTEWTEPRLDGAQHDVLFLRQCDTRLLARIGL